LLSRIVISTNKTVPSVYTLNARQLIALDKLGIGSIEVVPRLIDVEKVPPNCKAWGSVPSLKAYSLSSYPAVNDE